MKIWNWFTKKKEPTEPTYYLPADRAISHFHYSYNQGKKAKDKGWPCDVSLEPLPTYGVIIPVNKSLWETGWRGQPYPEDLIWLETDT